MTESLFESCGYVATFIGTLLEGEISLLTSVLGAKMGYYNYWIAMGLGFLGAWVADWFKFLAAKKKGKILLEKKPKLQAKFEKASRWFDKNPFLVLTFYKLILGTTTMTLIVAGLKNISNARFAFHSAISVALWVGIVGGLGYHCAEAMISNIEFISSHKLESLGILSLIAFLYWFFVKKPFRKECFDCLEESEP